MAFKHLVGFSGGIDSQACALWCRNEFGPENVILINSDAGGNEHPITTEFIESYSRKVHPVVMISPQVQDLGGRAKSKVAELGLQPTDPLTFVLMAKLKGIFPSNRHQFCTELLKLNPQKRWIASNASGLLSDGYDRYIGVRADESERRKHLPRKQWDDTFDCDLYRPLIDWTKKQCFDYVHDAGEESNPLYRMGFNRVGCAPCVNSNKQDIRQWSARHPEMIDKVREWEKEVGFSFFRPQYSGGPIQFVDDKVKWSKTARGGKQIELPIVEAEADAGSCVSKYGLCE